jgi:hypothetical protein
MRCRAGILGGLSAALALTSACYDIGVINRGPGFSSGYGHVNVSDESQGHVLPPVGYQCYPRYFLADGDVYDVNGHYYKEHNGDWKVLRSAPSLVRYETPQLSRDPRCFEYPP